MALFKYSQFLNETEGQPDIVLHAPELPSLKSEPARVELQIAKKPTFACPDDHRRRSIIATVIFFPMGLIALHWSKKTHERHAANNKVGAFSASDKAKTFSFLGIVVGIVFWIAVVLVVLLELVINI